MCSSATARPAADTTVASRPVPVEIDIPAAFRDPASTSGATELSQSLATVDALIRAAELAALQHPSSDRARAIEDLRRARAALYDAGRRALPPAVTDR